MTEDKKPIVEMTLLEDDFTADGVSRGEVILSAGLFRVAAQLAEMAKELDELQEIARARQRFGAVEGNVVWFGRKG
jgi:hypothetical protein